MTEGQSWKRFLKDFDCINAFKRGWTLLAVPNFHRAIHATSRQQSALGIKSNACSFLSWVSTFKNMLHLCWFGLHSRIAETWRVIRKFFSWLKGLRLSKHTASHHFLKAHTFPWLFNHLFSGLFHGFSCGFFDLSYELFLQGQGLLL